MMASGMEERLTTFTFPIDVVIVNYRTGQLVLSCLESLAAERDDGEAVRVIVVDNASGDGSAELIEDAIGKRKWDWVKLVRSPVNGGFGAGANLGIEHALDCSNRAEAIWLLNPDTRVMPGAVVQLASFMGTRREAGIVGTALLEGDGTPWPYAFRFPTVLGEVERALRWGAATRVLDRYRVLRAMGDEAAEADWVSGASLAIRRELLEQGLRFDEGYFLYYEETDLCRTARGLGWQCWYLPQAVVLHIAGQSTGVTGKDAAKRRVPDYWFASRHRYFRKNHGRLYTLAADVAWMGGHLLHLAKQRLQGRREEDPPRLLQDFARHSALAARRR